MTTLSKRTPQLFTWRKRLRVHPAADLLPGMSEAELRELGEDIKKNGLGSPIITWKDDDGKTYLLDGRNRLDAMELVGIPTVDKNGKLLGDFASGRYGALLDAAAEVMKGRRPDPYELVLSLNLHRRNLTAEQKRELIAKLLKARPEASNNTIGKQVKADDKTVGKVRRELEGRSEIPNVKERIDTKGRRQPAKKTKAEKPEPEAEVFVGCSRGLNRRVIVDDDAAIEPESDTARRSAALRALYIMIECFEPMIDQIDIPTLIDVAREEPGDLDLPRTRRIIEFVAQLGAELDKPIPPASPPPAPTPPEPRLDPPPPKPIATVDDGLDIPAPLRRHPVTTEATS